MDHKMNSETCKIICWLAALAAGLVVFFLMLGSLGGFLAVLLALVVALAVGFGLRRFLCQADLPGQSGAEADLTGRTEDQDQPVNTATEAALAQAAVFPPVGGAAASPLSDLHMPPGEATPEEETEAGEADKPQSAPERATEEPQPAPQSAAIAGDAVEEQKPRTLSAPREAGADDLKQLKGVGPKLEQTLNELGFWHFDQLAAWTPEQVAWVDARLRFKGRIERDGWIEQAKQLAEAGTSASPAGKDKN